MQIKETFDNSLEVLIKGKVKFVLQMCKGQNSVLRSSK